MIHCRAKERFAWGKSDILLNLRAFDATRDIRGYAALRSFCEEVRRLPLLQETN